MTFWYHMSGPHVGTLRIKLRYQTPEEYDQIVWVLSGDQGNDWKEGRVLLHKSVKHYQVSIGEGGIACLYFLHFLCHPSSREFRVGYMVPFVLTTTL